MRSLTNTGYAPNASTFNYKKDMLVEPKGKVTMGLLSVLKWGDAIYREEGIRVHVHAILGEYKITMIYQGGVYEGMSRISKVYKFLIELGIPVSHGWEKFYV